MGPNDRILRIPEVVLRVGLSHATIWRMERDGTFPRRIQIGPKAVGWRASEIAEWIEARQAKPLRGASATAAAAHDIPGLKSSADAR